MRTSIFTLLICIFSVTFSQSYEVLEAKKVYRTDGSKVKKGQKLYRIDTINIDDKGYLYLDIESTMDLKLAPGSYNIGQEARRLNSWYNTHLNWTTYLKKKGLIMCKFKYKTLAVPGSNRHYEVDRIELDQKGLVKIKSDTAALIVSWSNPEYKYKGTYYLIVRDFYNNGFIDIIETTDTELTFYPGKYGHRHMYYNVMAGNCRASLRYKLQVNSIKAPGYMETNFTQGN